MYTTAHMMDILLSCDFQVLKGNGKTVKVMAWHTLKASFAGLLFASFNECLMILDLIQHPVKAENGYKVTNEGQL